MNDVSYTEAVQKLRKQARAYFDTLTTPEDRARFLDTMASYAGVDPSDVLGWMNSDRVYTLTDLAKKQADDKKAAAKQQRKGNVQS